MSESRGSKSGWTFLKVIGVIAGLFGMIGFGLCSALGLFIAAQEGGGILWSPVFFGIGFTILCGWGVVTIFQRARRERERSE